MRANPLELIPNLNVRSIAYDDLHLQVPEVGFPAQVLWDALRAGWMERATTDENFFQLSSAQARRDREKRLAQLVAELAPTGAEKDERLHALLLAGGRKALTTLRGDRFTGVESPRAPKTVGARCTRLLACLDQLQDLDHEVQRSLDPLSLEFWVLLVNYDERRDPYFVYSELSCPQRAANGRLFGWKTRLLLPPFDVRTHGTSTVRPRETRTVGGEPVYTSMVPVDPRS